MVNDTRIRLCAEPEMLSEDPLIDDPSFNDPTLEDTRMVVAGNILGIWSDKEDYRNGKKSDDSGYGTRIHDGCRTCEST